jgi:thioredoxin reductase (NADPH)
MTPAPAITTDALVIGAGPVGLFQVFELGLLELHAEVVDALPHVGGQCAELYPDKPIYDIPGLPVVSGAELAARLQQQAAPFKPGLHLGQLVTDLARRSDGGFDVATSTGTRFVAKVVVIAAGAGAFLPKGLKLDGIEAFVGRQVLHHAPPAATLAGRQVVILGDEDLALDAANALAEHGQCARVTLLHRRDSFRASAAVLARHQALRASGQLHFIAGQPLALQAAADDPQRLQALDIVDSDGATHTVPADALLLLLGLSPRLGPIADWGLAMARRQLAVDTEAFETSEPGIYAVGDINTYPGKKKLLLCGFHEATLAAFAAAARLQPEQRQLLQYTTTSPRLHALLGVATPGR